jgi:hypothetical protein
MGVVLLCLSVIFINSCNNSSEQNIETFSSPCIDNVCGTLQNGCSITITGSGFGSNGPNIVIFDDFESGMAGDEIKIGPGSAPVGQWDSLDGGGDNILHPIYGSGYSVSGRQAMQVDNTKNSYVNPANGLDSNCAAVIQNLNATDIFIAYWLYMPTTSTFPCYSGDGITNCNWKPVWFTGTDTRYADEIIPRGLGYYSDNNPPSPPATFYDWGLTCNGCADPGSHDFKLPGWTMKKGKWYRIWSWIHGTVVPDQTGRKQLWISSVDDNMIVTNYVDVTQAVFDPAKSPLHETQFLTLNFGGWARWCNKCKESAARFDDIYLAKGPYAQARVEIGDAPIYADCQRLTVATVTSWSSSSITATIRQGSFADFNSAYLFVFAANGNANPAGFALESYNKFSVLFSKENLLSKALIQLCWVRYG